MANRDGQPAAAGKTVKVLVYYKLFFLETSLFVVGKRDELHNMSFL